MVSLPAGVSWWRICVAKQLLEELSGLHNIRDIVKEVVWIFFMTLQPQKPEGSAVLKKVQVDSVFTELGNEDFSTGKGWKLVTSGTKAAALAPPRVILVAECVQPCI